MGVAPLLLDARGNRMNEYLMQRRRWLWGLGMVTALMILLAGQLPTPPTLMAQAPTTSPTTASTETPSPAVSPSVAVPPTASPTTTASPTIAPSPGTTPASNLPQISLPGTPGVAAPPASTAEPLPLGSDYQDPNGKFRVGVLRDYHVTPLAGAVLIESPDGSLAYTVVAQSQPTGVPIGFASGVDSELLGKIATTVFQRGEGFRPGLPRPEAGGGVAIDWTGSLTLAGKAQPVGGTVLVRPQAQTILLLLVAATESAANQVPAAIAALDKTLQPL